VLIDPPVSRPEYYAFSVPLSSIYSLVAIPPSLSSWHGTVTINIIHESTLSTLHFHDDESRSVHLPAPSNSPGTYPPSYPPLPSRTTWGGESLIASLRPYANILRSSLEPTLFLVDPSRQDIETHSVVLFSDDAVDSILSPSSSPIPIHRRPRPVSSPPTGTRSRTSVLHASFASPQSPSASIMQSFSNITRATRHAAQQILSHPLAKPIVPHLPDPVRSLVSVNGEWSSWVEKGGMGEFESARVYLARWARIVAEEGERSRLRESLPSTSGAQAPDDDSEASSLGIFELIHSTSNLPIPRPTRNPRHPVDRTQWEAWFSIDGRPKVSKREMRVEVFRRVGHPSLRCFVPVIDLQVFRA
jgi:TBC1 domain family member 15